MDKFQEFIGVDFWTALFVLLNTIAIFLVAKKYLFVPVKNMIDSRQKEIDDMYAEAAAAEKNAKALESAYKEKLALANETGERIVKEAVARGQHREEEILRQANAEASAMLDKAAADIALEKKKAINEAKDEISGLAVAIAEKVVGRELQLADQDKLVEDFIKELGDPV